MTRVLVLGGCGESIVGAHGARGRGVMRAVAAVDRAMGAAAKDLARTYETEARDAKVDGEFARTEAPPAVEASPGFATFLSLKSVVDLRPNPVPSEALSRRRRALSIGVGAQ